MSLRLLPEADGQRLSGWGGLCSDEKLEVKGETKVCNGLEIDGVGDVDGDAVIYHFCPTCGSTLYWIVEGENPILGMAVGNFVDPGFPAPVMEFHVEMRHHWVPPVPGAVPVDESPAT